MSHKLPDYMIRPDDGYIFSINEDGETYSSLSGKSQYPNNLHNKYKFEILYKNNFVSCDKNDHTKLLKFENIRKEYFKKLSAIEHDGHGDFKN